MKHFLKINEQMKLMILDYILGHQFLPSGH